MRTQITGGNMSSVLKLVDENLTAEEAKEQYVVTYLKSMIAIEEAMEPYKEQKKDLRKEYIENGWLTKDDIWAAVKAFRLYEKGADMDDLNDMFDAIEKKFGAKDV
tara:strand:- start:98 stop:415 length:318 start_codon:yes stop_codon:yes gene_type:complete